MNAGREGADTSADEIRLGGHLGVLFTGCQDLVWLLYVAVGSDVIERGTAQVTTLISDCTRILLKIFASIGRLHREEKKIGGTEKQLVLLMPT